MSLRVGILTEYCDSKNYGGVLQAYALCKVINNMGYLCEQIPYRYLQAPKVSGKKTLKMYRKHLERAYLSWRLRKRTAGFEQFRNCEIPHNTQIFTDDTIQQSIEKYDIFITGSDQVWNPNSNAKAYYLEFVSENKDKISYAASLSVPELSSQQQEMFRKYLLGYKAISVRENDAVGLLQGLTSVEVNWVLDPTLLLTREEWDRVASNRKLKDKYILCYYLDNGKAERKCAEEYAQKNGFKVVNMPHFKGDFRREDLFFGDKRLYDVTPQDFLALIKNAECVFTDSFHAAVFSGIYEKEYFIFPRNKNKMASRIYNLTSIFKSEDHFCDTSEKMSLDYIDSLNKIDYSDIGNILNQLKEKSILFLKTNL